MSIASLARQSTKTAIRFIGPAMTRLELGDTSKHLIGELRAGIAMPVQHGVLAHLRSDPVRTQDGKRRKCRNAALRSRAISYVSNSLLNKGKPNVISRAFRIRHQDGGCRRIQSLHVYSRHGDP